MTTTESVYLLGGPRDNETLMVPRDGMVATVTHPATNPSSIHSVGSVPEHPLFEYRRSPLPDGWPAVFALSSEGDQAWSVERVMAKLSHRGKVPLWKSLRA